jgi:hypothetical protein
MEASAEQLVSQVTASGATSASQNVARGRGR